MESDSSDTEDEITSTCSSGSRTILSESSVSSVARCPGQSAISMESYSRYSSYTEEIISTCSIGSQTSVARSALKKKRTDDSSSGNTSDDNVTFEVLRPRVQRLRCRKAVRVRVALRLTTFLQSPLTKNVWSQTEMQLTWTRFLLMMPREVQRIQSQVLILIFHWVAPRIAITKWMKLKSKKQTARNQYARALQ